MATNPFDPSKTTYVSGGYLTGTGNTVSLSWNGTPSVVYVEQPAPMFCVDCANKDKKIAELEATIANLKAALDD